MKTILVTGGAGYLGSVLCRELLARNYRVRVFDKLMFGVAPIAPLLNRPGFELIQGDLTQLQRWPQLLDGIHAVVHLAGLANDPSCYLRPEMTERVNYQASIALARAAKQKGVRQFLFASSCSVYGEGNCSMLWENSTLRPVSLYAEAKARTEQALMEMADEDFWPTSLRQATLYGYSPRMRFDLAINMMVMHAITKRQIFVMGGGRQWRPFLHVRDAARAFIACLENPEQARCDIFNIGSNENNFEIRQLAELVHSLAPGAELSIAPDDPDRRSYRVNFDKVTRILGYKTEESIEQSVLELRQKLEAGLFGDTEDPKYYNIRRLKEFFEIPVGLGGEPVLDRFLPFALPSLGEEEEKEVVETLRSGWLTTGPRVQKFEDAIKEYVGCRHAIALNSCTGALHVSLAALGIGPGDEVITSPITWPSTANVIVLLGAKPVFVDVNLDTLNIDAAKIEEKITERTKAIVPVHMAGLPCELDAIHRIAAARGLTVIEDAAHAIGTVYKGRKIGMVSPLTCFSFYPIKNMTTIEGGVVTTDNDELAERIRRLSLHGITKDAWKRYSASGSPHWEVLEPGYKYNMTDVQAAVGLPQLKKLERFLEVRRQYATAYRAAFQDLEELELPVESPDPITRHAWHLFIVRLQLDRLSITRDELLDALKRENVGTGIHFRSLHLQHYYRHTYGYEREDFPHAAWLSDRIFSLPLYPKMEEKDLAGVTRAVKKLLDYYSTLRRVPLPQVEVVMDSYPLPAPAD